MLLLDAVNRCLRSTGESKVTAINSAHPRVAEILDFITDASKLLQRRGWWFNKFPDVTLVPEPTGPDAGKIVIPTATKEVRPWTSYPLYFPLNGYMWDAASNAALLNTSVRANVRIEVIDFEDLPDSFADYVASVAALDFASAYDADPLQLQKLQARVVATRTEANREHVNTSRLNLFNSGSTGVALLRGWGQRYGRYSNG
jgi:hypothetical protein